MVDVMEHYVPRRPIVKAIFIGEPVSVVCCLRDEFVAFLELTKAACGQDAVVDTARGEAVRAWVKERLGRRLLLFYRAG